MCVYVYDSLQCAYMHGCSDSLSPGPDSNAKAIEVMWEA